MKPDSSLFPKNTQKRPVWVIALVVAIMTSLVLVGTALAGQFEGDDVYRLEAGQVVNDDLYVTGSEIFIDGTVNGDLYAAGGYIEVNGTVTGDVVAAGGGIKITGDVQDDVRVAGGGIDITGSIGDDLIVAGGGQPGSFSFPMQMGSRSINQGIRLGDSSTVGGDAMIFGGTAQVRGSIDGDLSAYAGEVDLDARVGGDAMLNASTLNVANNSQIEGTLTYSAPSEVAVPAGVAGGVQYEPTVSEAAKVNPLMSFFWWITRTIAILVGFALLAWLLLRLAPDLLEKPVAAINANPVEAGLWGLLVFALFMALPLASGLIVVVIGLFWGWMPAVVVFFLLFGLLGVIWLFSPLVTGLWLGRKVAGSVKGISGSLPMLLVGILIIVLLGRVPCVGWLVAFFSFLLAMGGILQSIRKGGDVGGPALPSAESATTLSAAMME